MGCPHLVADNYQLLSNLKAPVESIDHEIVRKPQLQRTSAMVKITIDHSHYKNMSFISRLHHQTNFKKS